MENRTEIIKELALKKVTDSLDTFTFGDIKKVVCSNNYYEVVIDYKIKNINRFSVVKIYEKEVLEYKFINGDDDKDIEVEYIIY